MRLINVETGILEEFWGESIPKYAILSHTWGPEEVTFAEVQRFAVQNNGIAAHVSQAVYLPGFATPQASLFQRPIDSKAGYQKIKMACQEAAKDKFKYIWIDTSVSRPLLTDYRADTWTSCCIDNSSSAELSEAINSMYRWYKDAVAAYAYLEDVEDKDDLEAFRDSRWFTRDQYFYSFARDTPVLTQFTKAGVSKNL